MSTLAADHRRNDTMTPDALFPGHDGLRPDAVDSLAGRTLELHFTGRAPLTCSFGEQQVDWSASPEPNVAFPVGTATYEAILTGGGLLAASVLHSESESSSLYVFDFVRDRVLVVQTRILAGTAGVAEKTVILEAGIGGPLTAPFEPTEELVGKRLYWQYSDTHRFEHLYVEPQLYVWHGIEGPEKGMGGAEPSMTRKIDDSLYLFTWSDQSTAFNGAIVIDLADTPNSAGRIVQWDPARQALRALVVGAVGQVLNTTTYPA